MYQGSFARQWFSQSNYEPFSGKVLHFENSLRAGDYSSASQIIKAFDSTTPYWDRQRLRFKRILRNRAQGKDFISIRFLGFWNSFTSEENQILDLLRYSLDLPLYHYDGRDGGPDIEVCSCFNTEDLQRLDPSSTRILWLGENVSPSYIDFDYSMTHDMFHYSGRNLYLPLWKLELFIPPFQRTYSDKLEQLSSVGVLKPLSIDVSDFRSRKFCCMFTGNMHPIRSSWLDLLSGLGEVDCFGVMFGNKISSKHDIMKDYKFCFTPENSYSPGYITEKLVQCRTNGTVAIYWGGAVNSPLFNSESFIVLDPVNQDVTLSKIKAASESCYQYNNLNEEISLINGWANAL
jgi:alpha(1,3/1,4) fucosyltransferase